MMRFPWVSRDSYDGAKRLAESERENAQALRREVADLIAGQSREIARQRQLYSLLLEDHEKAGKQATETLKQAVELERALGVAEQRAAAADRESAALSRVLVQYTETLAASYQRERDVSTKYDTLMEHYHELRAKGYAPIDPLNFPAIETPLSRLGDKTKAALASMSRGMARINRAAMEAAALAMFAQDIPDEQIAEAVRKGESLRRTG